MGPTCILSGSQYWTKDTEHSEAWRPLETWKASQKESVKS